MSFRASVLGLVLVLLLGASSGVVEATTQSFTGAQTNLEVVIQPTDTLVEINGVINTGVLRVKAFSAAPLMPGLVIRITNNLLHGAFCFGCAWSSNTEEMNLVQANITIAYNNVLNTNSDNPWMLIGRTDTSATGTLRMLDSNMVILRNSVQTRGLIFANTRTGSGVTTLSNTKVFIEENMFASHIYAGGSEIDTDVCTLNLLRGSELHVRLNTATAFHAAYAQKGTTYFNMNHGSVIAVQDNTFSLNIRVGDNFLSATTTSHVHLNANNSRIFVYKNAVTSDTSFAYSRNANAQMSVTLNNMEIIYQQNTITATGAWCFIFRSDDQAQITASVTNTNFYIRDNSIATRGVIFGIASQASSSTDITMKNSLVEIDDNNLNAEIYVDLGEFSGVSRLTMTHGSHIYIKNNAVPNIYLVRSPQGQSHFTSSDSFVTVESNTVTGNVRMGHALNSAASPSVVVNMNIYGGNVLFTGNTINGDAAFALSADLNSALTTSVTNSEVKFVDNTISGVQYLAYTSASGSGTFTASNSKFLVEGNSYLAASAGIRAWSVAPPTTTASQGVSTLSSGCNITFARNSVKNGIFLFRSGGGSSTSNQVTYSDSVINVKDNTVDTNSLLFGYTINGASLNLALQNSEVLLEKNTMSAGHILALYATSATSPITFSQTNTKITFRENTVNLAMFILYATTSTSITATMSSGSSLNILSNVVQTQTMQVAAVSTSTGSYTWTDSTVNIEDNDVKLAVYLVYSGNAGGSLYATLSSCTLSLKRNIVRTNDLWLGYSLNGARSTFSTTMNSQIMIQGNNMLGGNVYFVNAGYGGTGSTSVFMADTTDVLIANNHLAAASINIARAWQDCSGEIYLSRGSSLSIENNQMTASLLTLGYSSSGGSSTLRFSQGSPLSLKNNSAITLRVGYADGSATTQSSLSFHGQSNLLIDGSTLSSSAFVGYGNVGGKANLHFNQSTFIFQRNTLIHFYFGYARETDSGTSLRFQDGSSVTLQQNTFGNSIYFNSANGLRTQSNVSFVKNSPLTITNNLGGSFFLGYAWNNGSTHSLTFSANSPLSVTSNTEMSHIRCFYCASGGSSFTSISTTSYLDISTNALRSNELFLLTPGAGCAQSRLYVVEDPLHLLPPSGSSSTTTTLSISVNGNQDVTDLRVFDVRGTTVPQLMVPSSSTSVSVSISSNIIDTALAVSLAADRIVSSPNWNSASSSLRVNSNQVTAGSFFVSLAGPVNNVEIDKNRLKSSAESSLVAEAFTGTPAPLSRVLGCNPLTDETLGASGTSTSVFWEPSLALGGAQNFQSLNGCTRTISMSVPLPTPSPPTTSTTTSSGAGSGGSSSQASTAGGSSSSTNTYFEVTFSTVASAGSSGSSSTSSTYTPPTTAAEFAQMIATSLSPVVGRTVDPTTEIQVLQFDATSGTASYRFIGDNAASLTAAAAGLSPSDLGLLTVTVKVTTVTSESLGSSTNTGGGTGTTPTTASSSSGGTGDVVLGPGNGPAGANNIQTGGGLSTGEQAGIIIGAAVFVGMMVGLLLFLVLRKKLKSDLQEQQVKSVEAEMKDPNSRAGGYTPQETSIFA